MDLKLGLTNTDELHSKLSSKASLMELPIPISQVAGHYLVFSVDAVAFLRSEHRILGVLAGSLPQAPQQNVFLGIPLELMPEEARLLIEQGVCYLVDEINSQKSALKQTVEEQERRQTELSKEIMQQQQLAVDAFQERKRQALAKNPNIPQTGGTDDAGQGLRVTLAASTATPPTPANLLPVIPASYPLYKYMHSQGYFLSPGLRFGSNYMAYPGDPLRFHSHFLCVALAADEEIPLIDIVGGGRLGTGVKKAFLIGGEPEPDEPVRAFCVEWGGM